METFKKRQKEMRRLERQRDKMARRMERKLHRSAGGSSEEASGDPDQSPSEDVAVEPPAAEAGPNQ